MTVNYKDLSKAEKQAVRAGNHLDKRGESRHKADDKNDGMCRSDGSLRNHKDSFKLMARWCQEQPKIKNFMSMTPDDAQRWIDGLASDIKQKTIIGYAVNAEHHLRNNCGFPDAKLVRPKSEVPSILSSRAYTEEALDLLQSLQTERAALSTQIARETGIRAHELITIKPINELALSNRPWRNDLFIGRENWVSYAVNGKGDLNREVRMSPETSERFEAVRLADARVVIDRDVRYESTSNLMGGKSWSNSFSKTSLRALGHSNGAHGTRHTYAQTRLKEIGNAGKTYEESLSILSQELGHFRTSITEYYLR